MIPVRVIRCWITGYSAIGAKPSTGTASGPARARSPQGLLDACCSTPILPGPGHAAPARKHLTWVGWTSTWQAHPALDTGNVQATLAQLTRSSIALAIATSGLPVEEVYVCGGGAHNSDLMQRLQSPLAPARLDSTAALGIDPDWVEAMTFAWLAQRTLAGLAGNAPGRHRGERLTHSGRRLFRAKSPRNSFHPAGAGARPAQSDTVSTNGCRSASAIPLFPSRSRRP